jgi:hypothetical protein
MGLSPPVPVLRSLDGVRPVVDRLRVLLVVEGGCTLSRWSGRAFREGIAVGADPAAAWGFPAADWSDRQVRARVAELAPRLDQHDAHLGAWLDPCSSRVWIEPVWVLPNGARRAAEVIGGRHGQRAIYDLGRRRLVPLVAACGVLGP